jgi:hypothetical protein
VSAIGTAAGTAVRDGVMAVATAMLPELPALGAGTAEHIGARVPEVGQAHAEELVLASCQANSNALLDALVRGVPLAAMSPSAEVMQTTRGLVQRGLTLPVVMRAYRIGIAYWCERWADAVLRHGPVDSGAVAVVSSGTSFLLGWLDLVADQLSEEYRDEAERLAREGSLARLETVRRVLADEDVDVPATSRRLGYDLAGRHLALVLHQQEEAPAGAAVLDAAAQALAAAITTARPLIVRVDVVTTWCWVPLADALPPRVPAPGGPVVAGHGRPASGLAGFRRSHREATEAVRVAELAGRGGASVTRYEHVRLASICSADPAWCRAFVVEELGALAADDDTTRRLRATLEAYFAEHSSFRATGKRLGIHHNTVRYRLEGVERLLGHPVQERRLPLELALHLASRLGPWIVAQPGDAAT